MWNMMEMQIASKIHKHSACVALCWGIMVVYNYQLDKYMKSIILLFSFLLSFPEWMGVRLWIGDQ